MGCLEALIAALAPPQPRRRGPDATSKSSEQVKNGEELAEAAAGVLAALPLPGGPRAVGDALTASELGVLATCSTWCRSLADDEELWRTTCLRTWIRKQHSAHMRRWRAEAPPVCGAPASSSSGVDGAPTTRSVSRCLWKFRYGFAIRDSRRCRILPEELCEDSACEPFSNQRLPRRWHLQIRLGRVQDKEVIFHPDGGFGAGFDFRELQWRVFRELPWRSFLGPEAESEDEVALDEAITSADAAAWEELRGEQELWLEDGSNVSLTGHEIWPEDLDESAAEEEEATGQGGTDGAEVGSSVPDQSDGGSASSSPRGSRHTGDTAEAPVTSAAAGNAAPLLREMLQRATGNWRPLLGSRPLLRPRRSVTRVAESLPPERWHARRPGAELLQVPSLPFLLRADRTPDWGWRLRPEMVDGLSPGGMLQLFSRQLTAEEHALARITPADTFTLYLQPCDPARPQGQGLNGNWECFLGFQGTMPAPTWAGTVVSFELEMFEEESEERTLQPIETRWRLGTCRINFASSGAGYAMLLSCALAPRLLLDRSDDLSQPSPSRESSSVPCSQEGHLDLFASALEPPQPCYWRYVHIGDKGQRPTPLLALVMTMGAFYGGATSSRPSGIPAGLPTLEDAALLIP